MKISPTALLKKEGGSYSLWLPGTAAMLGVVKLLKTLENSAYEVLGPVEPWMLLQPM